MDENDTVVEISYSLDLKEQFAVMIVSSIAAFVAGKAAEKVATNLIGNYRLKSADIQQ